MGTQEGRIAPLYDMSMSRQVTYSSATDFARTRKSVATEPYGDPEINILLFHFNSLLMISS